MFFSKILASNYEKMQKNKKKLLNFVLCLHFDFFSLFTFLFFFFVYNSKKYFFTFSQIKIGLQLSSQCKNDTIKREVQLSF